MVFTGGREDQAGGQVGGQAGAWRVLRFDSGRSLAQGCQEDHEGQGHRLDRRLTGELSLTLQMPTCEGMSVVHIAVSEAINVFSYERPRALHNGHRHCGSGTDGTDEVVFTRLYHLLALRYCWMGPSVR